MLHPEATTQINVNNH